MTLKDAVKDRWGANTLIEAMVALKEAAEAATRAAVKIGAAADAWRRLAEEGGKHDGR